MSEVYKVMFQEKFPRVLLEMEEFIQFILGRRIGYWFILKEHTIIRFYGFIHEPYIFPAFLTPRIFSLEFIRKNIIVENEDFLRTRNSSKIKFPLKVGPFIIKNKASLPVVEGLLQDMNFVKATKSIMFHIISFHRGGNITRTNNLIIKI